MKIQIVCVGSLKEKYWKDAGNEYIKRLSKFCEVYVTELKEKNYGSNESLINKTLTEEGKDIISKLKGYVIILDKDGKQFNSEDFAEKIENITINGNSEITFVIGSSHGMSKEVKEKANLKMSFSKFTFPHQLFRVLLLEQIYRAFTINNNIKYHK